MPTAGARPVISSDDNGPRHSPTSSTRYTPPGQVNAGYFQQESPKWVPILMFALWILGAIVIILYYLGVPSSRPQWQLLVGLGMILGGLYTATKYH